MNIVVKKRNLRSAPRKVRLVANLVKGMSTQGALNQLRNLNKRAAEVVIKLILSAIAAAKEGNLDENKLVIKEIIVDEGQRLKRRQFISRGRATTILKRTSHLRLIVIEDEKSLKKIKNKVVDKINNVIKKKQQSKQK